MNRLKTKSIKVGNIVIGGQNKVIIQSMTTTKTSNISATIKQILDLENVGCQLIRVAILDKDDALAIKDIVSNIHIPLVADIHFDSNLAILAIKNGAHKIRINPGNIPEKDLKDIVETAKEYNIPIRVGVNGGSLPKFVTDITQKDVQLFEATKYCVEKLEALDFTNIVISLKSSDILTTINANKLASNYFNYPIHLGITEAGDALTSAIRSSYALGSLLNDGIGDTIRISMSDDPIKEVISAKELLKTLNLIENYPTLISCPTCGRCQIDTIPIINAVKSYLDTLNCNIKVAIMGCVVNGPGEAKDADIGIAGGNGYAVLFKKGQIIDKIEEKDIASCLIDEINKLIR